MIFGLDEGGEEGGGGGANCLEKIMLINWSLGAMISLWGLPFFCESFFTKNLTNTSSMLYLYFKGNILNNRCVIPLSLCQIFSS